MPSPAPRRNDPCPCGSGLRYKECHGNLADAGDPRDASARIAAGIAAHREGRRGEARERYEHALRAEPGNAVATHYLGVLEWEAGNHEQAERLIRESISLDGGIADFFNNLGLLQRDRGDRAGASQSFHKALAIDREYGEAHNNLGLLLKDEGRYAEALVHFESAARGLPSRPEIEVNRGLCLQLQGNPHGALAAYERALLADPVRAARHRELQALMRSQETDDREGRPPAQDRRRVIAGRARDLWADGPMRSALEDRRYASLLGSSGHEAWEQYRWRPERIEDWEQRLASSRPIARLGLASDLGGESLEVLGEQGLGDTLFFLRWVPMLVARGATVSLRADPRLEPLLRPTGLFHEFRDPDDGASCSEWTFLAGDLPALADDALNAPPTLALMPSAQRVARMRERLALLAGGRRITGVTWRAGTAPRQAQRPNALFKRVPVTELMQAFQGGRDLVVSVQRNPTDEETCVAQACLGDRFVDMSQANDDLEEMLALVACLDDYIGVSNTNFHLRASLGLDARVLVPFPPEWRWQLSPRSPWFPRFRLYRESRQEGWTRALEALRADLGG